MMKSMWIVQNVLIRKERIINMMLIDSLMCNKALIDDQWVIARPLRLRGIRGFIQRLSDCWGILRDKGDMVIFYKQ